MTKLSRREMLKLGSGTALGTLAGAAPAMGQGAARHKVVPRWEVFGLLHHTRARWGRGSHVCNSHILYYMDFHQPIYYDFPLPDGTYSAEMLDPWGMTLTAVPGKFTGRTKLKLAGKTFQGVRFRRVG